VNNRDWYEKMSATEFVGSVGRHFRMGNMLLKDAVKGRLESSEGLSFTEFAYQVFQAYDWLYLLRKYNCFVQVGGHDQMGNIQAGHELVSRTMRKQVYGEFCP
jgi:tyrosyl-tRNA synthetase